VDFGAGNVAMVAGWNNAGRTVKSNNIPLIDSKKGKTPISLVTVSSLKRVNYNGVKQNVGALGLPRVAVVDSFFGSVKPHSGVAEPIISYELRGLDPSKEHTFSFYASRLGVRDIRSTKYTVTNGQTSVSASLNASNNISKNAVTAGIKPSADGKLTINVTPGSDNNNVVGYFYIGSMIVKY